MHHEAHVGLVDPHAEGDGGDHHLNLVAQEPVLHALALSGAQARVIGGRADALSRQVVRDLFHPLARQGVHDAGLVSPVGKKTHQLVERPVLLEHRVADVGPVESGDVPMGVAQTQHADDVLAGLDIGGGGEGHQRHIGEALAQHAERGVFRAEVVAPLGDAVGLVDGEEGDVDGLEPIEEAAADQPLGADVEQIQLVGVQARQHPAGLVRAEARVVEGGGHAVGDQGVDLVLHQRDQR